MQDQSSEVRTSSLPLPKTAMEWLTVFGPGAIVASLTIGTGELIFSTRGGALFGYRILFVFVVISALKWGLVLATARHMVLTGVHPYRRMLDLPGPRGWLPLSLLVMCALCLPIWIAFHAGVIGNLTSWITGTRDAFHGAMDYLWGAGILLGVMVLTATGGYSVLERVQMVIVAVLLLCATITLLLYNPDWLQLFLGLFPQSLSYPSWVSDKYPQIAENSVWVETTRYVGVIGGAGFDYLAYTSWLRQKRWGVLPGIATDEQLKEMAADPQHPVRRWIRAPYVDATISFGLIIGFSAVFVASGALILNPMEMVPDNQNLLNLQSRFVTQIHSWLLPLYVCGAFLTMIGTLYGTIEVAVSIVDEILRSFAARWADQKARRLKLSVVVWCSFNGLLILGWLFVRQNAEPTHPAEGPGVVASAAQDPTEAGENSDAADEPARIGKPRLLLALVTPANLFTGVLSCGLICCLNLWMDRRYLPIGLRMPLWLVLLNLIAGLLFLALGLKGYWDAHDPDGWFFERRWFPVAGLLLSVVLGGLLAVRLGRSDTQEAEDRAAD